jgi:hypothetical protein
VGGSPVGFFIDNLFVAARASALNCCKKHFDSRQYFDSRVRLNCSKPESDCSISSFFSKKLLEYSVVSQFQFVLNNTGFDVYFSMSPSAGYLEATVTMAAVAREAAVSVLVLGGHPKPAMRGHLKTGQRDN